MENKNTKMDINDMKDVFMFNEREYAVELVEYLKKALDTENVDRWNFIGYDVVSVDPSLYAVALQVGKNYIVSKDWFAYFIDHQNNRRSPIACSPVAEADIPQGPFEEGKDCLRMWDYDIEEYSPNSVNVYFKAMAEFLGVKKIIVNYNSADYAVYIMPLSPDQEKMSKGIAEFIRTHGYGPFGDIHPLDIACRWDENSFKVDRRYKRAR